jgi:glycosyltransferase involved in cell wall biosynthesis
MIVKDEAHVIEKCLSTVEKFIDYWVIFDTGSSDNTKEIIQNRLKNIPGELHVSQWVNFAQNRNQVLELARTKARLLLNHRCG